MGLLPGLGGVVLPFQGWHLEGEIGQVRGRALGYEVERILGLGVTEFAGGVM